MIANLLVLRGFVFFHLVPSAVCREMKERCVGHGHSCSTGGVSMFQFTQTTSKRLLKEAQEASGEGELEGRAIPTLNVTFGNPVECNGSVTCAGGAKGHGTYLPHPFPDLLEGIFSVAQCMSSIFAELDRVGMLSFVTSQKNVLTGLLPGLCFGLLCVIAPDHLGTIMTLSSATTRGNAFAVGAACGLGHSFGLVFMATIFLSLRSAVTVNMEAWEYFGNYLIGASMIFCGLYFIMREASFLVENEDGTYTAQPCSCHPVQSKTPMLENVCMPCDGDVSLPSFRVGGRKEQHSSVSEQALSLDTGERRDVRGALIGVLQGVCCPVAMVGLSFLATRCLMAAVCFLASFVAASALGTAAVAVVWAWATSTGICGGLSPKFAYRISCCFTLVLGIVWVIANYCGILEKLNYAEAVHHAQMHHLDKE